MPVETATLTPEPALSATGGAAVALYTTADCWRGASVSFVHVARGLAAHGFRPIVLATHPDVAREFAAADVPTVAMPPARAEAWQLRTRLRAFGAGVVMVDRAHDLRVATRAVFGTRVNVITRYNHFRPNAPQDLLTRIAYRIALREVVFLSDSARQRVLDETPFMRRVRASTIPEGVDSSVFSPDADSASEFRRTFGLGDTPFVLAVGALSREKRYEFMFEALSLLGPAAPPLVVCGEGPDERDLSDLAKRRALDVRFVRRVPRMLMRGAYSACDLLVHAGDVETFGLGVAEAMACARPVVVVAGGALPEVVGRDGSCGIVVPSQDPRAMAEAIRRLEGNEHERTAMGARARERARERFSLSSMQAAYAQAVTRAMPIRSEGLRALP